MSLVDKLKQSRLVHLDVGPYTFVVRRPTDAEAMRLRFDGMEAAIRGLSKFVLDWNGVKESDILSDGGSGSVKFDSELCAEWLLDRPELWDDMIGGILKAYDDYRAERDAQAKS